VPPAALIAEGGESRVYALGAARILRVLRRPADPALLARKQAFLASLDGRLPFAVSQIEDFDPDGGWTVERRIAGTSLLVLLRRLAGRDRTLALTHYAEAVDALAAISFADRPYGQMLAGDPVTAPTWRAYLRRGLDGFIAANGAAVEAHCGDLEGLHARALALLADVPDTPPKALVHGDYFPGNVMIGADLAVSGLVDFSVWTIVGDAGYDVISALVFLEMIAEATPDDIALVRRVVLARHGAALAAPARFYRAYFAFAMADPANAAGPYPGLWPWARANLGALAEDRLAF
jgi:aminoglycoside phosphotransferase (APT) family kinase protein